MQKKVAVITRTKNRPLLLQRCIRSVLDQTHADWLHVIVNDGGDPMTVENMVNRFAERYQGRAKIIHNEKSVGMQNAGNLGIKASESEFIAIHDDDDTWHSTFLEECVKHLEAAGRDSTEQGVAAQSFWVQEEMDSWGNIVEISRQPYLPFESISLFQTAGRNSFPPIAFLYRRRVHETIGYFDQAFNELGDYDFNLRFLARYNIGTIHKRLAGYHWRHQANGGNYANTVTDGVTEHRKMDVRMRNHYLRQDMANQRVGLGFLLNMANSMEVQKELLQHLHAKADSSAGAFKRFQKKLRFYEVILETIFTPWKGNTLPRRMFDNLSDFFGGRGIPLKKQTFHSSLAQLETDLQKTRVISLDVFDTALLRLVRKPTDVFLYIQNDVRHLLNRSALNFVEARIAAENEARRELRATKNSGEVSLDEIYAVLRRRLDCDEAGARQIKQWELAAELQLCYANPHIARFAGRNAKGSRKIIFASDMYLPAREITALLEHNGFKDAPLFVSSEFRASKNEGGLFDHILGHLKCGPSEMFHIGDNPHSDVDLPRARGIGAHHWSCEPSQIPLVDQRTSMTGAWEEDLASSLYTGLVRRRRLEHPLEQAGGKAFWEMIGYEIMGPLHHAFLTWIISRARKMELKKLFFLARDGFNLVKMFELFRVQYGLEIQGEYLFASRRLWNFARIERLDEENMTFLVTPNPMMRAGDFLRRIDIDPQPHETLARRCGFNGLDELVTTQGGIFKSEKHHQNMRRFLREFENEIILNARKERDVLARYFNDAGLSGEQIGIVDIGWGASSVRSLQTLLAGHGRQWRIPAFYFGTWSYAQSVLDAGCEFESFFMHLSQPLYRSWLMQEGVELLEWFFSAPYPSIVSIEKKNGEWQARYGEPEADASARSALEIATETAFEFVRDALAIWPKSQELAPAMGYLDTTLERLLRYPTRDEAVAFGGFSCRNTFGGAGPLRQFAAVPSGWRRVSRRDALQDAYDHCFWKKGFLARLSPKAREYVET